MMAASGMDLTRSLKIWAGLFGSFTLIKIINLLLMDL